ncbi:putative NADPH-quinone reductase (modulator of drug activity B) [Snodgrassella alvi SCGC AB-598-O02]|nr:NAD(P)H-dependent oxidoreductase [Snodgrassella alvi]KES09501.1 putative NADPH-quinone reductase (modulator of drug activity B) [Snodgrassella alvi SCGC AB-598-O02]
MKRTLVIAAHPHLASSTVNQCWLNKLNQYNQQITIHDIYLHYPSYKIDSGFEQSLVENHQNLVIQFPIYWFNCPPLLKLWLDKVFTYGWAFGSSGDKLKNKKIGLAVSAGIKKADYSPTGHYKYTLEQILKPFELTINYVNAHYQPIFAIYGANNEPNYPDKITLNDINKSADDYVKWMKKLGMLI